MGDVFDLTATLKLDSSQYENGLNQSEGKASSFGSKLATAAKVGATAIGVASTAIGAMAKTAVSGFAEQQQLIGGVQKLYGNMGMSVEEYAQSVGKSVDEVSGEWSRLEQAQNMVVENANNAYKTAGISANQYMDMATSFSAALINSMGGDTIKAAEKTDVAMRAMSDNWNTFGGDLGMIQGAFQGFAKQNFTMLDNLKLGYGGTKEEMERLIADANEYASSIGEASDLSIDSFADIVTAIDLIQQKQNVAGTTSREAGSTVSGSIGMIKAAWENLMTGLADSNADIDSLMNYVVDAAEVAFTNMMPVIETALSGIGSLIEKIAPIISEKLPGLVETILPPMLTAATSLIIGIANALPSIIGVIVEQIPVIALQLFDAIQQTLPGFIQSGYNFVTSIASGLLDNLPVLIETGGNLLVNFISSIMEKAPEFMDKGKQFIVNLASGVSQKIPAIVTAATNVMSRLIATLMQNLPSILEKGVEIVGQLAVGIGRSIPKVVSGIAQVIAQLLATIAQNLPQFLQRGIELLGKVQAGIIQAVPQIIGAIPGILSDIAGEFTSYDWLSLGRNIISGIANGISAAGNIISQAAENAARTALNTIKSFLGIKSPSRVFRKQVGEQIGLGLALGIRDSMPSVMSAIDDLGDEAVGGFDDIDLGTSSVVSRINDSSTGVFDMSRVMYVLESIANTINGIDESMAGRMQDAMSELRLEISGRNFGRIVRDVRTA